MMLILTVLLQHLNIVTLYSLMMTPYHSQVRIMLTPYIIQL